MSFMAHSVKIEKDAEIESFLFPVIDNGFILIPEKKFVFKRYVMFENTSNICWLNSALAILVNNKTLCCSITPASKKTLVVNMVIFYRNRMTEFNFHSNHSKEDILNTREKLKILQQACLKFLRPSLKCQDNTPDSAFCALSLFISKDPKAVKIFSINFTRFMKCEECNYIIKYSQSKCIITLTEVKTFDGELPVTINKCSSCNAENQKMYFYYHSLPPCLFFHFEKGVGKGKLKEYFVIDSRKYILTGVIALDRSNSVDHFVTWIRDHETGFWLQINDLLEDLSYFTQDIPYIRPDLVYILSYEALDGMGIISRVKSALNNIPQHVQAQKATVPLIDLSDESDANPSNECSASVDNSFPGPSTKSLKNYDNIEAKNKSFTRNVDSNDNATSTTTGLPGGMFNSSLKPNIEYQPPPSAEKLLNPNSVFAQSSLSNLAEKRRLKSPNKNNTKKSKQLASPKKNMDHFSSEKNTNVDCLMSSTSAIQSLKNSSESATSHTDIDSKDGKINSKHLKSPKESEKHRNDVNPKCLADSKVVIDLNKESKTSTNSNVTLASKSLEAENCNKIKSLSKKINKQKNIEKNQTLTDYEESLINNVVDMYTIDYLFEFVGIK